MQLQICNHKCQSPFHAVFTMFEVLTKGYSLVGVVWNGVKRRQVCQVCLKQSYFSFLTPEPKLWLITKPGAAWQTYKGCAWRDKRHNTDRKQTNKLFFRLSLDIFSMTNSLGEKHLTARSRWRQKWNWDHPPKVRQVEYPHTQRSSKLCCLTFQFIYFSEKCRSGLDRQPSALTFASTIHNPVITNSWILWWESLGSSEPTRFQEKEPYKKCQVSWDSQQNQD